MVQLLVDAVCAHHSHPPLTVHIPVPQPLAPVSAFRELWSEFDPDAEQRIPADELPDLVRRLNAPMGLKGAPRRWAIRFWCAASS